MGFMDNLSAELAESSSNLSYTENGMEGYKSMGWGKKLVDLNFAVASMRGMEPDEIERRWIEAYVDNPKEAIKWLFYAGDVRGGLGERRLFRIIFNHMVRSNSKSHEAAKRLLYLIPEYNRWDSLFVSTYGTNLWQDTLNIVKDQLRKDIDAMKSNQSVSLMAKWLPVENTRNKERRAMALSIINSLGITERNYRKVRHELNVYLDTVELKINAKEFAAINYEKVPSKANLKYKDLFLKNDEERRNAYLESVSKGEAKIHAGVVYPYEIVAKYTPEVSYWNIIRSVGELDRSLEEMWRNLPNYDMNNRKILSIVDGSGSMWNPIPHTEIPAWCVGVAMGIYYSERLTGELHNTFMSFGRDPQIIFARSYRIEQEIYRLVQYKYPECI